MINRRKFIHSLLSSTAGITFLPNVVMSSVPKDGYLVLISMGGGMDGNYMFDARPLSMTKAGLIHNYIGKEPIPLKGKNGQETLISPLATEIINKHFDSFSILNGLVTSVDFDGHIENFNWLFGGDPFGGQLLTGVVNDVIEKTKIDTLKFGQEPIKSKAKESERTLPLNLNAARSLLFQSRKNGLIGSKDWENYINSRYSFLSSGNGSFSLGVKALQSGFIGSFSMQDRLKTLTLPDEKESFESQMASFVNEFFKAGLSRTAVINFTGSLFMNADAHSYSVAKQQPVLYKNMLNRLSNLLTQFKNLKMDNNSSLMDKVTFLVVTEFGRTNRQLGKPISQTGTDHNPYSTTALIGGKGFKSGMIVGESDFRSEKEKVSDYHKIIDPILTRSIGHPYDFVNNKVIRDYKGPYDVNNHLTISGLINTLFDYFGVDKEWYRETKVRGKIAKTIDFLRS